MQAINNVFIEDINAYIEGLEARDFQFCNIISNRITTDAVFLESKEFALFGAILKDFLPDFQRVEESFEEKVRKDFIDLINIIVKYPEKLDCFYILNRFSDYFDENKKFFTSSFENYSENKDYTTKTIHFCLTLLKEELDAESYPASEDFLILGALNEISRASKQFGCTHHQHILQYILSFSH